MVYELPRSALKVSPSLYTSASQASMRRPLRRANHVNEAEPTPTARCRLSYVPIMVRLLSSWTDLARWRASGLGTGTR